MFLIVKKQHSLYVKISVKVLVFSVKGGISLIDENICVLLIALKLGP